MNGERLVRSARASQREQILQLLIEAGGEVPTTRLAEVGGLQYSARVHELRAAGHNILNRTEVRDGVRRGFFRLASTPNSSARVDQPQVPARPTPDSGVGTDQIGEQQSLFGGRR